MKFLIAVAALLAVAAADERVKRGILSYAAPAVVESVGPSTSTVISGPSGQIVSNQNNPGVIARSLVAPGVVAAPSVYSAYGVPSVYSAGLVAPAAYSAGLVSPYSAGLVTPYAAVAPGVTAGTVYAPGTTLVGPSTNGAPGAVITNSPYGSAIYV